METMELFGKSVGLRNKELWHSGLLSGLRPILPLLQAENITEIEVFAYNKVRVKGYGWKDHLLVDGVGWETPFALETACLTIASCSKGGRGVVNDREPIFDGYLPGGERVHIVMPHCARNPYVTIRKFPCDVMTLERLIGYGSINDDVADLLKSLVALRKKIMVAGGTESGKTSLLNALSLEVADGEKIVTLEDSRELQIQSDCWQSLETVKSFHPDMKDIELSDLVKASLRMSPDRIIVGEVRGIEALHLLLAFTTGHDGGMGTVHCDSAEAALSKLKMLVCVKDSNVDPKSLTELVASAIDIVVYVKKIEDDNTRKVTQIIEVDRPSGVEVNGERLYYRFRELVRFERTGFGELNSTGLPTVLGDWIYPCKPSQMTCDSIRAKNLVPGRADSVKWPEASLKAKENVKLI